MFFFRCTEVGRSITSESVLNYIKSFNPVTARMVYVVIYILGTVLLLPGTALSFAGAVLFGAYQGTLFTWMGAVIGSVLAFLLAKALGREFVDRLFQGKFEAFNEKLRENGFTGLLLIRLLPIFPFNGVNVGSGLTGIRLKDYILATAIGILPGTFVYQFLFAKFGRKILTEGFKWSYLKDPELGIALGLFALFILFGKWLSNKVYGKENTS